MSTLTKVKICRLSRECDIEYANRLKPDYIGYVFWQRSRRYVTREQAEALTRRLDGAITPVGVFVDEEPELVSRLANDGTIKLIQLHGHENEEYLRELKSMTDAPIIKAFKIRGDEDIEKANTFPSDYILLDNGYGTGQTFDWSFVRGIKRPFFLAGGVNADNVRDAIDKLSPYADYIRTGVETAGHKDFDKMLHFNNKVRY